MSTTGHVGMIGKVPKVLITKNRGPKLRGNLKAVGTVIESTKLKLKKSKESSDE